MSGDEDSAGRPDPRTRPPDPAGTRPKVDLDSVLPARIEDPAGDAEPVDAEIVEEGAELAAARAQDGAVVAPGAELEPVAAARGAALGAALPRETEHTPRFQFLLGAFIALAAVAVAGALALGLNGSGSGSGPNWSPWKPGGDKVRAIANHVGPEYRLSTGEQLVAVTGGGLKIAGLPMQIALRTDPANGGNISLLSGKGVLYRLCGLGPKCSIDQGKPSVQRHLLLRREALELALYTFRYVDGIDQVVIFMPPPPGKDPSQALFFRHGQLSPELDQPLRATLTTHTPTVTGVAASPDAQLVNRLTTPTLYSFSLTAANQDASVFLVLAPPTAASRSTTTTPSPSPSPSPSLSRTAPTTTTP
jgi:hypothetical protein